MATRKTRVGVIGAGVGGLTAAHELVTEGFAVTLFEARTGTPSAPHTALGGKARSGSGALYGLPDLPIEHGFRFFPGFYRHVIETMGEIASGTETVAAHLVDLDVAVLATNDGQRLEFPLPRRKGPPTWRERGQAVRRFQGALPGKWECACYLGALARLATSCEERWLEQLEHQSWLQYVNPSSGRRRSEEFQRLFSKGLTRTFVATRAEQMSARTGGRILLQLLYDMFGNAPDREPADRVLDGPTSEVWIEPWYEHLKANKVEFELGQIAVKLELDGTQKIRGVRFCPIADATTKPDEAPERRDFDHWVLAIPCEQMKALLANSPQVARRAKRLARVFNLETAWMSGLQFGCIAPLPRPLGRAHVMCLDSPWALTLLDQMTVWSDANRSLVYSSVLSIDISDWDSPGLGGVSARLMQQRDGVRDEVWAQLREHLPELPATPCEDWALDPDIELNGSPHYVMGVMSRGSEDWLRLDDLSQQIFTFLPKRPVGSKGPPLSPTEGRPEGKPAIDPRAQPRTNAEPLLINTPGSWENRPEAACLDLSNLFLAADYVQTDTDFASMEAANEAAKEAVDALVKQCGRGRRRAAPHTLQHPPAAWFRIPQRAAQQVDQHMFRLGMRAPFRLPIAGWLFLYITVRLPARGTSRLRRALSARRADRA